jgi:hypothetical protein
MLLIININMSTYHPTYHTMDLHKDKPNFKKHAAISFIKEDVPYS